MSAFTESAVPSDRSRRAPLPGAEQELRRRLLERHAGSGPHAERDRLVADHIGFAESVARRYLGRGVQLDDLRQTALLALVQAAERFDPERGVSFVTFAGSTIDGSIKRYFRDHTWNVRPPRPVQELHLRVRTTTDRLAHRLGRQPTVGELATELDVDVDEVHLALEASMAHSAVSIDRSVLDLDGDPGERAWLGRWDTGFDASEARVVLHGVLARLEGRDREIIHLRFVENLSQQEIAARLGISQSYLSRVIRRILATMRAELGDLTTA